MKKILQSDWFKNLSSSCIAVIVGLLIGIFVIVLSNSAGASGGISALLTGPINDGMAGIGRVIYYAVPIIMTGLSVGFAFKTGLFNIGTPGQFIVGAFVAVYIGVKWTFIPASLHWVVALLGAFVAGGVWAIVPGVMKAYLNVNEVISSIMMNYIGLYFVNYSVTLTIFDSLRNQTQSVASSAVIPKMGLDTLFEGSPANGGFFIAILFIIIMYIVLNKTTFGYEMKACGFNKDASRYAGINERRNIVLSMVIAGALAGLGGGLLYLSGSGKFIEVVDVMPAEGFNGIPVALLGLSNPIGILFAGIFIAYLNVGGSLMQQFGFIPQIVDIIISCIIYCSALSLMIKLFLENRKKKKKQSEIDKGGH